MSEYRQEDQAKLDNNSKSIKPYKVYMYIESYGMAEMIAQRARIARQWLDKPCMIKYDSTFFEADKAIHSDNYSIFITDDNSYYKLIKSLSTFKVKLEKDFYPAPSDPYLDTKPLYYQPQHNTLFIRRHSAHNSRFLYEILKLALEPPIIVVHTNNVTNKLQHSYYIKLRKILKSVLPYVTIDEDKKGYYMNNVPHTDEGRHRHSLICHISIVKENSIGHNNSNIDSTVDFSVTVKNPAKEIKDKVTSDARRDSQKKNLFKTQESDFLFKMNSDNEITGFLWVLNERLENKGFMSMYNDKEEVCRAYKNNHL